MKYNWQQKDWPDFKYELDKIEDLLYIFSQKSGHIGGMMEGLSEEAKSETIIEFLVSEAIKTSEIEGEYLSRHDVMSSIKRNLGISENVPHVKDLRSRGISELMIDVRKTYNRSLSKSKLFTWHKMIMLGSKIVKGGAWRKLSEPMQVISGSIGKEKVHFEAPPSNIVPDEMVNFIYWFNRTTPGNPKEYFQAPIRSGIAHLYFESIHPFEDGNGRVGRALSEKALSQGLQKPALLSLSKTIEKNKKNYYAALKEAQRSNEITSWLIYFIKTLIDAQESARLQVEFTLKKTRFFDKFKNQLNQRQIKVINRMLQEGYGSFEGGMNAKKYMSITSASKATTTRDLQDLHIKGIFRPKGAGRSTRYNLNLDVE